MTVTALPAGLPGVALTAQLAAEHGMRVVHWSIDTGDRRRPGRPSDAARDAIVARATARADPDGPDPILPLHDGKASAEPEHLVSAFRGSTVAALPAVIRHHRDRGRVFRDPSGDLPPGPFRAVG